jgi:outer membrane receptor protein involved in Fe transport
MVKPWLFCIAALALLLPGVVAADAATIRGVVTDVSGAPVPGTRVVLRDVATGQEIVVETGADGTYQADVPTTGTYLISVTRAGFSEAAQTVVVDSDEQSLDVPLTLEVGSVSSAVVVTAARAERDTKQIPLHVDTIPQAAIQQTNQTSVGDALTLAANITPVGNGPFGVRPRLRGLDSTRLLVLVDGARLNTARQATERTGAEVGLVSPDSVVRMEVVNGAGTVMYGSDALAGTINIITNEASFTPTSQWLYGFNGFYSSNENGMRGTGTLGYTSPTFTVRVQAGAEDFEDYTAGSLDEPEDTRPLFDSGVLTQGDTIDDNFGFNFNAFPEPFNTPYVRTDSEVVNSQAHGNYVNASSLIKVGDRRSVRIRYQRRRMNDIGFPDFAQPYFFNDTSLPFSNLDRVSARYEAQAVTPWLANLSASAYYQRTDRRSPTLMRLEALT